MKSIVLTALFLRAFISGAGNPDVILQNGHGANISALAFSPNGKFLVSASEDATLKVWEPGSGAEIRTLRGHSDIVTALAVSADGTQVASASLDHTLRLWNLSTGETLASFRGPAPTVYLLKITPDKRSLVTAETVAAGTILRLWDIRTGRQVRAIQRDDAAVSHVFFSGSNMLVGEEFGDDDSTGSLVTYSLQSGRQLQTRPALLCGASEDGKWIAIDRSTERARKAVIVDLARDTPLSSLSGQVSRVVFSSTGEWLAYESLTGDTAVVRKTTGGSVHTIRGRGAEFSMLALSPDGRWLATAGKDFSLHIWDVGTGKLAHARSGQYTPTVIAFSPDGQRVAVNGGGTDVGNALQIWNIGRKSVLPAPSLKRPIVGLSFSKDGSYLAVSSPSLEIFDLRTSESFSRFDCGSGPALTPTFGPNGKWIAANCGGTVTVWPLTGGVEGFHFGEVPDSSGGPLVFSPDGRTLAAATSTGVTIYDIASHHSVQDIKMSDAVASLAFSPNGEWLAVGLKLASPAIDGKSLLLFDTRSQHGLWAVDAGRWVSALRFTPDGHLVATAADMLTRFDVYSGRMIHRSIVKVPNGSMPVFSANGEWLAVGSNSATALWRVPMNN